MDPEKRPWRQLPALLSFLGNEKKGAFDCLQLRIGVPRVKKYLPGFGLWSGGLRVSSNAGEQYVSGSNDFVESELYLDSSAVGDIWFSKLKQEMDELDQLSKITWSATMAFFKAQKAEGKDQAVKDKLLAVRKMHVAFLKVEQFHLRLDEADRKVGDERGDGKGDDGFKLDGIRRFFRGRRYLVERRRVRVVVVPVHQNDLIAVEKVEAAKLSSNVPRRTQPAEAGAEDQNCL